MFRRCRLPTLTTTWSQPFAKYFVDKIHPSIEHLGAWMFRDYGLDSVTTNQSEAFNHVLKRLQDWREAPVDSMVLSLFRLSQYHLVEIRRGLCGQGEYCLRDGLEPEACDVVPSVAQHPSNIVDGIRDAQLSPSTQVGLDNGDSSGPSSSQPLPSPAESSSSSAAPSTSAPLSDLEPDDDGHSTPSDETSALTSAERAAAVIRNSHIALDTKLAIFTVKGTNEPRVVRLFPTSTCSCPAKSNCYHVLAAQMAVGMPSHPKKRTVNLTQLRKNTRKRPDKTSGRKRPRLEDVDVIPADDHDPSQTAQLQATIQPAADSNSTTAMPAPLPSPTPPPAAAAATSATVSFRPDICHACCSSDPPAGKCRRRRVINWVCCDKCDRWYHTCCVHVGNTADDYVCGLCE